AYNKLTEEIELIDGASTAFDLEQVRAGQLTPVFFGSALQNFGVEIFLKAFLQMALPPTPRLSEGKPVDPVNGGFSAFVF
ncbi:MAG TPA: peptide chain release factor 3, partial [Lachnospiraceae bacterium]|nr:peptide chain release factor 3 [Lachnospiraceae bacterium]